MVKKVILLSVADSQFLDRVGNLFIFMKKLLLFLALIVFIFGFVSVVDARSGCCSWHGGVCGCGCCDGTSLSATCAPYYPSCNHYSTYVPPPTPTPMPDSKLSPLAKLCQENYGINSHFVNYLCACDVGYQWNDNKTQCISSALIQSLLNQIAELQRQINAILVQRGLLK